MNKQELIKEFEEIGIHGLNMFGTAVKGIPTETAIKLIKQLDEPESGYAYEAPRYLKNVLARLRELPLHNREVWLKVIMSEFKQDFSHAKWREGYEQGKLEGLVEREKVKVTQFVAEKIEYFKKTGDWDLFQAMDSLFGRRETREWLEYKNNQETFARAWLDGYEVEEEKRYTVVMKTTKQPLYYNAGDKKLFFSLGGLATNFTQKQLEEAGFGWVFDCPGIEIEEVE